MLVVGCSPAFQIVSDRKEDAAAVKAVQLQTVAKTHAIRNEDARLESLDELVQYAEEGEEALLDPWGFPYQMVSKPGKGGFMQTYIWTVSPYTGKRLGHPPPEEKDVKKDK